MNNTPLKLISTRLNIPGNFVATYPTASLTVFILSVSTILLIAAFQ